MAKQKPKNKGGRPSKYRQEFKEQAYRFALLGFTDIQIAAALDIDEKTLNNWKKEKEGFFQSLKDGRDVADSKVAGSLYKRANGYQFKEVKEKYEYGQLVERTETIKEVSPDTGAAMAWLKNRQPELWRDKQEVKHEINEKTDYDKLCEMAEKEGLKVEDYCKRNGINLNDYIK